MKLLTKEIIAKLEKTPLYSTENQAVVPIIVKFFNPCGAGTWYAVEGTRNDTEEGIEDWLFFGLYELQEKELGYFRLSELQSVKLRFGLKIERDMYFDGMILDKITHEVRRKECAATNVKP